MSFAGRRGVASRAGPRLYTVLHGAVRLAAPRRSPTHVRRVLIVHNLLLGDTVMLTPLVKKACVRFPDAEIVLACPPAYLSLYEGRPYGVTAVPLDPRSLADHVSIRRRGPFDLALAPGDNRWSWLARAAGARWIVAFHPAERSYKDWPVDEMRPMPGEPTAWGDMAASLIDGPEPAPYAAGEWPAPAFRAYARPSARYCVLHPGAGNPNRLWPAERWRAIIEWAEAKGYEVVVSAGPGEEPLAKALDPAGIRSALAGRLDLAQLWDLLRRASFLVCPDTGIAHLARLVGVPTVAIYGQGSPISTGPGRFWARSPFKALWDEDVVCRDQQDLFGRRLQWLRRCSRTPAQCANPFCIRRIAVEQVTGAIETLLTRP
jgi:ADP-heptose:LPS heptosyltransferase